MPSIIERVKLKFPPSKNWKYEKQTEPPTFGWASRVSDQELNSEVEKKRETCKKIIENTDYSKIKKGKVSLFVLSCKRLWTLERLLDTATPYFKEVENYENLEKTLVDNGSGEDLLSKAKSYDFFDNTIEHKQNLGMIGALRDAYERADGEYILFFEDDFYVEHSEPFIQKCIDIFNEYPEIGIIKLKNQNNWWKPFRKISNLRKTKNGTEFWTWLPSDDGRQNVWSAGSVMFRKVSYDSTGAIEEVPHVERTQKLNHAFLYEEIYGERYNKNWLAAKIKGCCPFVQPNDNQQSPGWE